MSSEATQNCACFVKKNTPHKYTQTHTCVFVFLLYILADVFLGGLSNLTYLLLFFGKMW